MANYDDILIPEEWERFQPTSINGKSGSLYLYQGPGIEVNEGVNAFYITGSSDSSDADSGHIYQESLNESSTTSSNWKTKVTLTTPTLSGSYRVAWRASVRTDGDVGRYRLRNVSDNITYDEHREKAGNASDVYSHVGGFTRINIVNESKTFTVQYRDNDGGHETKIKDAKIEFWRIR